MNQKFAEFIFQQTGVRHEDQKPGLKLAEDIGFYGMDAITFFDNFFHEFQVKNLSEFDADLHIDGSVDFAPQPINWVKNIVIKKRRKYLNPDVTLGHLEKVAASGQWFNER